MGTARSLGADLARRMRLPRASLAADLARAHRMGTRRALRWAPTWPRRHRMSHPPRASLGADLAPPATG
jgi:hypothetical protein